MIDGHVHLEKGPMTREYALEFINEAVNKGITKLQILDHTHRFYEFAPIYEKYRKVPAQDKWLNGCINTPLDEYIKLIEELKKTELPIEVSYGLEVCYQPDDEELIRKLCSTYNWDFLVGSVHAVDYCMYDSEWSLDELWNKNDVDYIYRKYYENIFALIESEIFTQLGHPDTIKMFDYYPTYDLTPTYNKLAELLNKHNMKVENNVGCYYRYHHKDMGLSDELLKIFKDHKCELITASDAHYPKDVGTNIKDVYSKTMY